LALCQNIAFCLAPGSSFPFRAAKKKRSTVQTNGPHGITAHFLDLHLDFGMLLRGTSSTLALALPSFFTGASVICSGTGGVTNTAAARMAMAVVQESGNMGLNFAVYS